MIPVQKLAHGYFYAPDTQQWKVAGLTFNKAVNFNISFPNKVFNCFFGDFGNDKKDDNISVFSIMDLTNSAFTVTIYTFENNIGFNNHSFIDAAYVLAIGI